MYYWEFDYFNYCKNKLYDRFREEIIDNKEINITII